MNRQERSAAAAHERRWKDKTADRGSDGMHYWFEPPEGWTREAGVPDGVDIHGPFTTVAEVEKNQQLVLLGPECEVTEGGMWDPAWDRLK